MTPSKNPLISIFGVPFRGQSYLNAIHVWLAFPLGLTYFIFLIVGFSLGVPLIILWVGLLILLFVFAGWWLFAELERWLAIALLRVNIPPMTRSGTHASGIWEQVVTIVTNPVTWKSLVYLVAKFPWGIICFTVSVTFIALTGTLLIAPVAFPFLPLQVWWTWENVWVIDTLPEALLAFVAGVVMVFVTFHVHNGLAWISGQLARIMLGNYQTPLPGELVPVTPLAPASMPPNEPVMEPFTGEPPAAAILTESLPIPAQAEANSSPEITQTAVEDAEKR